MKGGEKMAENKVNWWIIIGVAVVVAVIASLITANITGNVITLNQDRWGKYQVYTKAEIDELITPYVSDGDLFYFLDTAKIYSPAVASTNETIISGLANCHDSCKSNNLRHCILSIYEQNINGKYSSIPVGCNENYNITDNTMKLLCVCGTLGTTI